MGKKIAVILAAVAALGVMGAPAQAATADSDCLPLGPPQIVEDLVGDLPAYPWC